MTTIQITLPDKLAADADQAGLLSSRVVTAWLEEQLKHRRREELFAAMDRMAAVDDPTYMSPEEVEEEMASMQIQRRILSDGQ
jgi:hypothetical protein